MLNSDKYCYLNGQMIVERDLRIDPYDLGFLRGYAVFDFMTTVNLKPFLPEGHYQRLVKSAQTLKLEVPVNFQDYQQILNQLLKKNAIYPATIRTIITGGVSPDGLSLGPQPTFLILIKEYHPFPAELYTQGAKVITVDYARYLPLIKTTHYIEAVRHQTAKQQAQATEIIYTKDNQVYEASTSNVFIVKDGQISTTKEGILSGITRGLVLDLLHNHFKVQERELSVKELLAADEVFLTASGKNVMPVTQVDKQQIGTGQVGEMTKKVMQMYADYLKKY